MKLIRTGFFREMPHGETSDPLLKQSINTKYGDVEKQKICDYLKAGIVIVACGGTTLDVISEKGELAGCPEILTDGVWIWPGDLVYYVQKYDAKLDSKFITHMIEHGYRNTCTMKDIDWEDIEFE